MSNTVNTPFDVESIEDALREASARRVSLPPPAQRVAIRQARGLRQVDIARALKITQASVSRYELDRREPLGDLRIAYALLLRELGGAW